MRMLFSVLFLSFLFMSVSPLSSWQKTEGSYRVPVPEDLEAYAHFPLDDLEVRTRNGLRQFRYTLPLELTGEAIKVRVEEGRDDSSNAICVEAVCRVRYPNLKLDEEKVVSYLNQLDLSESDFNNQMEVFSRFLHDPEGEIILSE